MKVTIASFALLGIFAILGNVLDFTQELRYFFLELILVWITGTAYAQNASAPFKVDIGIGVNIALFFGTSEYRV